MEILDVDLVGFERGDAMRRRAVVDGTLRSLSTGFVYVAHDVRQDELDRCYAMLDRFFTLPESSKARHVLSGSRGQRGYTGVLVEKAAGRRAPDWKEMFNWGESLPPEHPLRLLFADRYEDSTFPDEEIPGIGPALMDFHRSVAELQRRFLRIVAEGLGARADFFDALVHEGATLTRAIHYPPMAQAPSDHPSGETHVWAAEHGDINLVTALPRATAPGLEVKTTEGWVSAEAPTGSAILNTGMMLEHISNGALPTGIHRVVAPAPSDRSPADSGRLAVVQFCHPTPSTLLAPLPSCVGPDRPARYAPVSAAEWLDDVLKQIGLST